MNINFKATTASRFRYVYCRTEDAVRKSSKKIIINYYNKYYLRKCSKLTYTNNYNITTMKA